jgi:hypothetical protein
LFFFLFRLSPLNISTTLFSSISTFFISTPSIITESTDPPIFTKYIEEEKEIDQENEILVLIKEREEDENCYDDERKIKKVITNVGRINKKTKHSN